MQNMLSRDLKAALKTVVGTCGTLGVLIESKSPFEVEKEIDEGKYDKEIKEEATETDPEKKKELDAYFKDIKEKQDQLIKQEEAAKAAAEAKEEKAAPSAPAKG